MKLVWYEVCVSEVAELFLATRLIECVLSLAVATERLLVPAVFVPICSESSWEYCVPDSIIIRNVGSMPNPVMEPPPLATASSTALHTNRFSPEVEIAM
jgi:hypothetical protein